MSERTPVHLVLLTLSGLVAYGVASSPRAPRRGAATLEEGLAAAIARCDLDRVARLVAAEPGRVRSRLGAAETPLDAAARGGCRPVVEFLLERGAGADLRTRGPDGGTPLHAAAERGFADVAAVLLSYGADVRARDAAGATPLDRAERAHRDDVAELLRRHGVRGGFDPDDFDPLRAAAHRPIGAR